MNQRLCKISSLISIESLFDSVVVLCGMLFGEPTLEQDLIIEIYEAGNNNTRGLSIKSFSSLSIFVLK